MGPLFSPQRSPKEGFTGVESAETALSPLKVLQLYAQYPHFPHCLIDLQPKNESKLHYSRLWPVLALPDENATFSGGYGPSCAWSLMDIFQISQDVFIVCHYLSSTSTTNPTWS